MFDMSWLGKSLIVIGALFILAGVVVVLGVKIPWIGKLPGDIVIQKKDFTFIFPLTTCIVISILISLAIYLFRQR